MKDRIIYILVRKKLVVIPALLSFMKLSLLVDLSYEMIIIKFLS